MTNLEKDVLNIYNKNWESQQKPRIGIDIKDKSIFFVVRNKNEEK